MHPTELLLAYLPRGRERQRRLTSGTNLPYEHSLQGFYHFRLIDPIGVAVTKLPCWDHHTGQ